jgi:hypothetical protein
MVLYILTFTFPDNRREDRRLWTEWQQAFPGIQSALNLFGACNFALLVLSRGIRTLPHLQRTCSLSLCYAFVLSSDYVTTHINFLSIHFQTNLLTSI